MTNRSNENYTKGVDIMKNNNNSKGADNMDNTRIFGYDAEVTNDTYISHLNNNDMIIGTPGSGKTTGYVIPNLCRPSGSYIVADTKGSLYKKLGKDLISKGYNIKLIDFSSLKNSCSYNPLDNIEYYSPTDYCEQDVISLSALLFPTRKSEDPFWQEAARAVVASLIAYVLETLPRSEHNMVNVVKLYRVLCTPTGQRLFRALEDKNPESFAVNQYKLYYGTMMSSERTWNCITQFITNGLWLFDFRESKRIFGKSSDFSFEELGKSKTVFFLNISDSDRSLDTLVNIFYTQAFQALIRSADSNENYRLDVPVRIILDDFATNAFIPDFDKILSVIRSREISVSIILQNISQLDSMYNQGQSKTIINNCDHLLYLGGQDPDTAQFIAMRVSKSPESILDQSIDKAYLITRGSKARLVNKLQIFDIPEADEKPDSECDNYTEAKSGL